MDDLNPTLLLIWDVKRAIKSGRSVQTGISRYLKRSIENELYPQLCTLNDSKTVKPDAIRRKKLKYSQQGALGLLRQGINGHSILLELEQLEAEVILSCESDIETHAAHLPLKLMIPLMGLVFPSMMLILIVPLLKLLQV